MTHLDAQMNGDSQRIDVIEDSSGRKRGFPERFRIGKLLGKGGFAKVYEVVDSETGMIYAAKIILKASVSKPRALAKLRSEIAIHRSLNHEKSVKFYDYFEDSEKVYILLELCPNQTLNEYMRRRPTKRLSESEAIFYVNEIIVGLKYLHSHRIIHRDLKLGNLFLDADARIKLGDFGLAAKLECEDEKKRTICGTPNYIAPEILDGRSGHSYEVDIWSLGVIIYTMLFGRPPFETQDVKATYRRIRYNQYTFPDNVQVSDAAKELIGQILRTDPKERPTLDNILASRWLRSWQRQTPTVPAPTRVVGAVVAGSPRPDSARIETPCRGDMPDFARIDSPAPAHSVMRDQSPGALSARGCGSQPRLPRGPCFTPSSVRAVALASGDGHITPGRQPSASASALRPPILVALTPNPGREEAKATNTLRQPLAPSTPLCTGRVVAPAAASPIYGSGAQNHICVGDENAPPQNWISESKKKNCAIDTLCKEQHPMQETQRVSLVGAAEKVQAQPRGATASSGSIGPTSSAKALRSTALPTGAPPLGGRAGLRPATGGGRRPDSASEAAGRAARCRESSPVNTLGSALGSSRSMGATPVAQQSGRTLASPKASALKPNSARTCVAPIAAISSARTPVRAQTVGELLSGTPCGSGTASMTELGRARPRCVQSVSHREEACEEQSNCRAYNGACGGALPEVHVTKWVDYSSKYGIGYTLSDGTLGVYFNDSTKMILADSKFDYITRRDKENPEVRSTYSFEDYPEELKKKVTLLGHFQHYMAQDAKDMREGATAGESALPPAAKLQGAAGAPGCECREPKSQAPVYVRKWTRNKNAILFQLSNKIVQVIFFDRTEAVLSSKAQMVTYVDKVGHVSNHSLSSALDSPNQEIAKRLKYTREILVNLLGARHHEV